MALGETPLKGTTTQLDTKEAARGVTFRIARAGKQQKGRRFLILRGFARAEGGSLTTFTVRAMLDSGAEGNFISPTLARKINARIVKGDYGRAVEAFGGETKSEGEIPELLVSFRGAQPHSGLAQDFHARISSLVAPCELGEAYELLLGEPFLTRFSAQLRYGAQGGVQLTAADGTTTTFARGVAGRTEEEDEREATTAATAKVAKCAYWYKPETGAQRRERRREYAQFGKEDGERAQRAWKERPDLVMRAEELEELMRKAAAGTVVITPILPCGWQKDRAGDEKKRIRVNQITARGAEAATKSTEAPKKESSADQQGQLPPEERARAEAMREKLEKEFPTVFTNELVENRSFPSVRSN